MVAGSAEIANKINEKKATKAVSKVKDEEEKDTNIFIGRDFSGDVTKMCDINEYSGKVIVSGSIISTETKEIKNDKVIFFIYITDGTGSVMCKCFMENAKYKVLKDKLKSAKAVCIRGLAQYDSFEREVTIKLDDMKLAKVTQKQDNADKKRVKIFWFSHAFVLHYSPELFLFILDDMPVVKIRLYKHFPCIFH